MSEIFLGKPVHDRQCKICSGPIATDPEAEDISNWVADGTMSAEDAVFPCGLRPEKLCRGVVEQIKSVMP